MKSPDSQTNHIHAPPVSSSPKSATQSPNIQSEFVAHLDEAAISRYRVTASLLKWWKYDTKMATLNWIGKEAVVNHHHHVPFHLLKDVPERACSSSYCELCELPKFDGPKAIYCAGCLLGREHLQRENITVRQTPFEIKVS